MKMRPFVFGALLAAGAAAADTSPANATAGVQYNEDGSVAAVHDSQSLNLSLPLDGWTVQASAAAEQTLTWPQFIHEVFAANLDYAAARYNVDMARADASAAGLLPNPTLSLSGDRDLTYHDKYAPGPGGSQIPLRQSENRSIGVDQPVEWWGKRHWRTKMADQALRAAAATLDDFLRNLKLDAASAYADALTAQRTVEQLRAAAEFLGTLAAAQETRYNAGDIGRPDLLQTQVEEREFLNDLSRAEDDAQATRYALSTFLGRNRGRTDFTVTGQLKQNPRDYDLAAAIEESLKKRADLVALRNTRDAAQSGVELARHSIVPDLDVSLTYGYNSGVATDHPVDPTPGNHQLTLGLAFPVPLFDRGQYAVAKAKAQADQAQAQLAAAELHAEVDIRTAWSQYQSALKRTRSFDDGILKDADELLEARRYGYQRGANSLLELIDAQRSDNQIRQDYDQALSDVAKALIQLERATGVEQGLRF